MARASQYLQLGGCEREVVSLPEKGKELVMKSNNVAPIHAEALALRYPEALCYFLYPVIASSSLLGFWKNLRWWRKGW